MQDLPQDSLLPLASRRHFLRQSGQLAAASALAGITLPYVHGQENPSKNDQLQVALIGCGGRGTGAASNALSVSGPPVKLVATADVDRKKMNGSLAGLTKRHKELVDVPEDRQFIGFDGFKKAIDCLRPQDVAILTTPCAFRWVQFAYCIEKGVNVFMEKPLCPDGPSSKRMYALGEKAKEKNLKVAVGLMCRHSSARQELHKRIMDGAIGEINLLRCYRMHGPAASCFSDPKPEGVSELLWQISRFHSFLWLSGGSFSDFMIHNIDESCWMKAAFPVQASALGGRHYREGKIDQNFDTYDVEYTFADGAKLFMQQRNMLGCADAFASFAHGSKGSAIISTASHAPAKSKLFKSQLHRSEDLIWAAEQPEPDPYQVEWDDLLSAIRTDTPYNEVKRSVDASLTCVMGRMAAHTGQIVSWDDALNCPHEMSPHTDQLTMDGPSPLLADAKGLYPIPMPGRNKKTEY